MIDLDSTTFGTTLVSPDRKLFEMCDAAQDDAGARFAWVRLVLPYGSAPGKRTRLYYGEANGWMTLAHVASNPARYVAYLFSQGSDKPAEVVFDARHDAAAKSYALTLVAEHGAAGYDLHRVRPQSVIEAEIASRKRTVPLAVRVL